MLLAGLAPDGGLYLPQAYPQFFQSAIAGFGGRSYEEAAQAILTPFVAGEIEAGALRGMIALALGALMLLFSARVYYHRTGAKADRCARQLFGFSILYLFLLFAAIVGERLVAILAWNIPS